MTGEGARLCFLSFFLESFFFFFFLYDFFSFFSFFSFFLRFLAAFFSAKAKSRASRSLPVSFTPQASMRTRCAAAGASFK